MFSDTEKNSSQEDTLTELQSINLIEDRMKWAGTRKKKITFLWLLPELPGWARRTLPWAARSGRRRRLRQSPWSRGSLPSASSAWLCQCHWSSWQPLWHLWWRPPCHQLQWSIGQPKSQHCQIPEKGKKTIIAHLCKCRWRNIVMALLHNVWHHSTQWWLLALCRHACIYLAEYITCGCSLFAPFPFNFSAWGGRLERYWQIRHRTLELPLMVSPL